MMRRPSSFTRTDTHFPSTTLSRCGGVPARHDVRRDRGAHPRHDRQRPPAGMAGLQAARAGARQAFRSEEHTSELQSLMRISYAVLCLKKKNEIQRRYYATHSCMTTRPIILRTE